VVLPAFGTFAVCIHLPCRRLRHREKSLFQVLSPKGSALFRKPPSAQERFLLFREFLPPPHEVETFVPSSVCGPRVIPQELVLTFCSGCEEIMRRSRDALNHSLPPASILSWNRCMSFPVRQSLIFPAWRRDLHPCYMSKTNSTLRKSLPRLRVLQIYFFWSLTPLGLIFPRLQTRIFPP